MRIPICDAGNLPAKLNTLCPDPSPERCEPRFRQRRSGKRGNDDLGEGNG